MWGDMADRDSYQNHTAAGFENLSDQGTADHPLGVNQMTRPDLDTLGVVLHILYWERNKGPTREHRLF